MPACATQGYFSGMFHLRPLLLVTALVIGVAVAGQQSDGRETYTRLDMPLLQGNNTKVPGMGEEVPGLALSNWGKMRLLAGDGPGSADRALADSAWATDTDDLGTPPDSVYWLRFHFLPVPDLKGRMLALNLGSGHALLVFLNGDTLFRYAPGHAAPGAPAAPPFTIPFSLRCDGQPEVLAIRLQAAGAEQVETFVKSSSLHSADMAYRFQQYMMQFGMFIGVNLIILVLALVIWRSEPGDRRWLYLALLSALYMVDTFLDVGGSREALGFPVSAVRVLEALRISLLPWPFYLLILTLGSLHGQMSPRRMRWYHLAVGVAALGCIVLAVIILLFRPVGQVTFSVPDTPTAIWVVLLVLAVILSILIAVAMAWFMLEVVRLGLKLMRTPGHARWVGVGALASSVVAFLFNAIGNSGLLGEGLSNGLVTLATYCSGIGVPVSVAVFLAIRTADHGKLVARQRDVLDAEVKERTAELSHEKERAEELLLNILPAEVAEELKNTGKAQARHFDQVSVLFTDFQGFTSLSSSLQPEVLLDELNACFEGFDAIITRRGIEKIKTIGDSYMCATGLNATGKDAPANLVWAALEMQDFLARRKRTRDAAGLPGFTMRAGIHTGPVVAGIVGVKKFQYDIWGDTVNTASRMESNGEVGRVNISETTYLLVRDTVVSSPLPGESQTTDNPPLTTAPAFAFTPRGNLPVKGKGELAMYFVRRANDAG